MCGRYTLQCDPAKVGQLFDLDPPAGYDVRYNIAPSQDVLAVRREGDEDGRAWAQLRWGLVPFWADGPDDVSGMINARAETAYSKSAFRQAFERRRCLIPADGFYEWKETDDGKQPYRIHLPDDRPFALAGLWERWEPEGDEADEDPIESCAILTRPAEAVVADLHERMPVILDPDVFDTWLSGEARSAARIMDQGPADELEAYLVSRSVNSPKNDRPELLEPADT
ncbi:MAG: SOS response-associated peptidase [Phycisphaeraceae bacterium]|nr:SOS response-associated peptidase [Phycisphaeraceae bacterium]